MRVRIRVMVRFRIRIRIRIRVKVTLKAVLIGAKTRTTVMRDSILLERPK